MGSNYVVQALSFLGFILNLLSPCSLQLLLLIYFNYQTALMSTHRFPFFWFFSPSHWWMEGRVREQLCGVYLPAELKPPYHPKNKIESYPQFHLRNIWEILLSTLTYTFQNYDCKLILLQYLLFNNLWNRWNIWFTYDSHPWKTYVMSVIWKSLIQFHNIEQYISNMCFIIFSSVLIT